MAKTRVSLSSVSVAALSVLAFTVACDPAEGRDDLGTDEQARGQADSAADPGQLSWSQMAPVQGAPAGVPLFVSNNPEHVEGYGILAGVPYPGLSLSGAQRAPDAPQAQWSREVIDERCVDGGAQEFGVYIAHILPSSLGSGRRVTLVVVPQSDVEIEIYGDMDTSNWSDGSGLLTTRTDWIGAEIAKDFFFRNSLPTQTITAKAGEMVTIDSQLATSLVEGRYHIKADGCLHPFTIAHSAGLGSVLPGHYAPGDVKWPGWYHGAGFGRAAGVYEADGWRGAQTVQITDPDSVQGVGLLTADDSVEALARHMDSAEILFGNYGVLYDQTLELSNDSGECVDLTVEFVSYLDRNNTPDRTPTVQFFRDTDGAYTPSMFWNGPVEAVVGGVAKLYHPVLHYAPTAQEQADPTLAMGSMRHEIASLRLDAGTREDVTVRFPVPGYIVAPIALTVQSESCG